MQCGKISPYTHHGPILVLLNDRLFKASHVVLCTYVQNVGCKYALKKVSHAFCHISGWTGTSLSSLILVPVKQCFKKPLHCVNLQHSGSSQHKSSPYTNTLKHYSAVPTYSGSSSHEWSPTVKSLAITKHKGAVNMRKEQIPQRRGPQQHLIIAPRLKPTTMGPWHKH